MQHYNISEATDAASALSDRVHGAACACCVRRRGALRSGACRNAPIPHATEAQGTFPRRARRPCRAWARAQTRANCRASRSRSRSWASAREGRSSPRSWSARPRPRAWRRGAPSRSWRRRPSRRARPGRASPWRQGARPGSRSRPWACAWRGRSCPRRRDREPVRFHARVGHRGGRREGRRPGERRTDRETRDIPRPWPEARSQLRRDERSQSLVLAARRLPSPAERAGLRGRIRALRGQRGRRRGALALPRPQDGALRLTLHLEPSVARIDEVSGQAGRKLGSENKLIFDRELIPNTLFGAINLLYDVERMKERHNNFVAERAANAGVGAALTFRVTDDLFLGGEARYLRAYEGFGLRKWQGEAVYVGPTLFARFLKNGWISAAWNYQVNGRTATNRANRAEAITEFNGAVAEALAAVAEPPEGEQPAPLQLPSAPAFARRGHKDLVNFERHQLRLKVGFEF